MAANSSEEASRVKLHGVPEELCRLPHSTLWLKILTLSRNYLSSLVAERTSLPLKRHIFSTDVAVQTDSVMVSTSSAPVEDDLYLENRRSTATEEDVINKLTSADLASILRWSKEISRDIHLSLALQSLTEIATGKQRFSQHVHPLI